MCITVRKGGVSGGGKKCYEGCRRHEEDDLEEKRGGKKAYMQEESYILHKKTAKRARANEVHASKWQNT